MASIKRYRVTKTKHREGRIYLQDGTLPELVYTFKYTLECGQSYQHEKGNRKINCNPKNINSLITNLNRAINNSAANGYAGSTYTAEEIT